MRYLLFNDYAVFLRLLIFAFTLKMCQCFPVGHFSETPKNMPSNISIYGAHNLRTRTVLRPTKFVPIPPCLVGFNNLQSIGRVCPFLPQQRMLQTNSWGKVQWQRSA